MVRSVFGPLVLGVCLAVAPAAASPPPELWVAPLDGRALDEAAPGAEVRDRLPDAVLLDNEDSATAFRAAGLRVIGPLAVPAGHEVFLLRPRPGYLPPGPIPVADLERPGGPRLLWTDGETAIVTSDGPLPEDGTWAALSPRILAAESLPRSRRRTARAPYLRHSFDPRVASIVAGIDSAAYFPWIRRLSGAEPVTVGGETVVLTTRHTNAPLCEKAEQYVLERFQAMGYTDVVYDPFSTAGTSGRNVIATLPGRERPGRVVILCGHLDSRSPEAAGNAPGANDNASGTAAVLAAAEAMQGRPFRATVRFIAFTGEEQGLLGSEHYAASLAASADTVIAVLNADMIAWWAARRQVDIQGDESSRVVMEVMVAACREFTDIDSATLYSTCCSDHVPFLNRGIPSFLAIESDYFLYPCYHQTCDTASRNLGGFGAEVARALTATAAQIAGPVDPAGTLPIARSADPRPVALRAIPNPFTGAVTIRVAAGSGIRGVASVHDASGRRLRSLGSFPEGGAEVVWDGHDEAGAIVPAGVYFVRVVEGGTASALKVVRIADR